VTDQKDTKLPRRAILVAFGAALEAASPEKAVLAYCRLDGARLRVGASEVIDTSRVARIWVVGAGKATPGMALGVQSLFGDRVSGAVVTKDGYGFAVPGIDVSEAGHPYPDRRSVAAARRALRIAAACPPHDLLVCLLSGGASALWAAPPVGVSLRDLRQLTESLLRSGAPIEEINTVRKHVSRIAGGRLAAASSANRMITLAVSDVIAATPDNIGSGPTLTDSTTASDAMAILRDRGIEPAVAITRYLSREANRSPEPGRGGASSETRSSFRVIASVDDAIDGAARSLARQGIETVIVDRAVTGEAREVAGQVVAKARAIRDAGRRRVALIWGGETTVTQTGDGKGGRNQEIALAAALLLESESAPDITVAAFATDGSDGPTDAAGGFADSLTVSRGEAAGRSARRDLEANDSYRFLDAARDRITTGPTGTNVNDLIIALIT